MLFEDLPLYTAGGALNQLIIFYILQGDVKDFGMGCPALKRAKIALKYPKM